MSLRLILLIVVPLVLAGGLALFWAQGRAACRGPFARPACLPPVALAAVPDADAVSRAYGALTPPERALAVYHLGHSLVGRDMPAMLEQLAPAGHDHASQLGWGSSLKDHWTDQVNGFAEENDHPRFRPARTALSGGGYDAVVLTEMVELKDALRFHDSAAHLGLWAGLARQGRPDVRLYLYETWHRRDTPETWRARLDDDLQPLWLDRLLLPELTAPGAADNPVRLIPAGQVMAAFDDRLRAAGPAGLDGMRDAGALFRDDIHLNDLGAYLVALTHYAVLYHRDPRGLPTALLRADGSPATPPGPAAARAMQEIVWQVVTANPLTGVAPQ